jgi:hypothetical protein
MNIPSGSLPAKPAGFGAVLERRQVSPSAQWNTASLYPAAENWEAVFTALDHRLAPVLELRTRLDRMRQQVAILSSKCAGFEPCGMEKRA